MNSACSMTQCGGLSFVWWWKVTCWWVTEQHHGRIVWLLGSTRWKLIVCISCLVCETSQSWVNFNNSPGKQNRVSPQVWPQDCHLWPYTAAALGASPGGRSSQAHRSVFLFQSCHQRLFYVLLMVLLGCFLSEVGLDEFVCFWAGGDHSGALWWL